MVSSPYTLVKKTLNKVLTLSVLNQEIPELLCQPTDQSGSWFYNVLL